MSNGRWRSAVNGPGWTDIRVMMVELAKLHKCQCYLELAPDGYDKGGAIVIRALLVSNTPVDGVKPAEIGCSTEWPSRAGMTIGATVYGLLHKLDREALARWWEQQELTYGA